MMVGKISINFKYTLPLIVVYLTSLLIGFHWGRYIVVQMVVDTFLLVGSILIIYLLRYPKRFLGTVIFVYWFLTKLTLNQVLIGISMEMAAFLIFIYAVMLLLVIDQYLSMKRSGSSHSIK